MGEYARKALDLGFSRKTDSPMIQRADSMISVRSRRGAMEAKSPRGKESPKASTVKSPTPTELSRFSLAEVVCLAQIS